MAKSKQHWGDWIESRSQFVGFKRKRDFAAAIGCSDDQLTKWLQMESPPAQMRKGFDRSLARALATTRRTLFIDYANVSPKSSRVFFIADHVPDDLQTMKTPLGEDAIMVDVWARMLPSEKDKALEYAIQLVMSKQDRRSTEFKRFMRQLHGDEPLPESDLPSDPVTHDVGKMYPAERNSRRRTNH